jgi:protein TonB
MTMLLVDDRGELLRWALSGVAVVFLHGGIAAAVLSHGDDDMAAPTAAMVIELTPIPVASPESSTEVPPGPPQVEAQASPYTPVSETKELVEEKVETEQPQEQVPELTPVPNPEVALASAAPKPEQQPEVPQENQLPAPETTAPPPMPEVAPADVAAAPVQGAPLVDRSDAIPAWRSAMAELLERNKRYPADAKNARGVAEITFLIDRRGRLVSSRLVKSSGSSALDREALDLVRRAQPFPLPPAAMRDVDLNIIVPVRFFVR